VWIYCLVWWFIQDAAKVMCYKLVEKYNIFDANTGAVVNVRATRTFDDKKHPLARMSAGMVETKLLNMKVRGPLLLGSW
jgi:H+-transporting ATPase